MQLLDRRTVRQGQARDGGVVEVRLFQPRASCRIDRACKVDTVPCVNQPHQRVVAKRQRVQVGIDITLCRIADFQVGKMCRRGNINGFHHDRGQVAKRCQHVRVVDTDDGVLRARCRPYKFVGNTAEHTMLNHLRVIIHMTVHIDVSRQRDVALCVRTDEDSRVHRGACDIFAVQIAETVVQPPLAVLFLLAL